MSSATVPTSTRCCMSAAAMPRSIGPDGSSIAEKLPPEQEGLLIAEIDLGAIGVAKNAADPAGHYSRPDVTRLLLNKKPQRRVEPFALPVDSADARRTRSAEVGCRCGRVRLRKEEGRHGICHSPAPDDRALAPPPRRRTTIVRLIRPSSRATSRRSAMS